MPEKVGGGKPQEEVCMIPFHLKNLNICERKSEASKQPQRQKQINSPAWGKNKKVLSWLCQSLSTESFPVENVHFQQLSYSKLGQLQPEHSAAAFNKIQPCLYPLGPFAS